MNNIILFSGFLLATFCVMAQPDSVDYIRMKLENVQTPEERVDLLNKLSYEYTQLSLKSAEVLAEEALEKATEVNYQKGMATSYNNLGISHSIRGDYSGGLGYFVKALRIREDLKDLPGTASTLNNIARVFHYQGNFEKAIDYATQSIALYRQVRDTTGLARAYISLGDIYLSMKDDANALATIERSREIFASMGKRNEEGWALLRMANVLEAEKAYERALETCNQASQLIDVNKDLFTVIELYQTMGLIYAGMGNEKEASRNLHRAMALADRGNDSNGSMISRLKLANLYRQFKLYDSALFYMDAYNKLNAAAFDAEKARQLMALEETYQAEKKDKLLELRNEKIKSQSIVITVISLLLLVAAILGFVTYRYYRAKKKSTLVLELLNREIHEKHEEILAQSEELSQANEEISRINETLEAEVTLRAEKIEQQNKKLIDYAYFNAHNVRGPLARILGLTMLMEREAAVEQVKDYNRYLLAAAQELDAVIKDINSKLE